MLTSVPQQEDTTRGEDQDQTTVESAIFIEDVIQINKGTKAQRGLACDELLNQW